MKQAILLVLVLMMSFNQIIAQSSTILPSVSTPSVKDRLILFANAFCDSFYITLNKFNTKKYKENAKIKFIVKLKADSAEKCIYKSTWEGWRKIIGSFVTADSTFYYSGLEVIFYDKTQRPFRFNHTYSQKEISELTRQKRPTIDELSKQLKLLIEHSLLINDSGLVVLTKQSIDLTLFKDSAVCANQQMVDNLGLRITKFLMAFLQQNQFHHYQANLYIIRPPGIKIAKFTSPQTNISIKQTTTTTGLKTRNLPIINRAQIFSTAMMATMSVRTFRSDGDSANYINLELHDDMNLEDIDTLGLWTYGWGILLADFIGDSLEVYKEVRFTKYGRYNTLKEYSQSLVHPNPYLISKEVFDVPMKIKLFNARCWQLRDGLGKLEIRGKKLVLNLKCSVHWFKKGIAQIQMQLVNDGFAKFVLAYILRNQLSNYTGFEVVWENEESHNRLSFDYNWKNPIFSDMLELQINNTETTTL
ncbi:hypothetical protein [Paraflavitalea sp. CAU 1676]|uniref:hypothetical protein n=1 Tax=Paraflavitalea sp. CAU 1676 TaxID=3032598 RepID=UPI0023DCA384|nr:hypothetical protein [Paraflavitalea sp. CAU 1676]MDF2190525.1 hypothetical protein [Paraflavitalea sp. CAU 1676]